MPKIKVQIIPELWDISGRYFENKKREVELLAELLEKKDFQKIGHMAHQMKGNAGTYGMKELSQLAERLMNATAQLDTDLMGRLIVLMKVYLSEVELEEEKNSEVA